MKLFFVLVVFGLFLLFSCQKQEQAKTNVIILITDDQGYGDLACHGNPYILTPNLDQFSNEAVSFTNFHVSTTCAPTRGALMTGRHTNRLNVFTPLRDDPCCLRMSLFYPRYLVAMAIIVGCSESGTWEITILSGPGTGAFTRW